MRGPYRRLKSGPGGAARFCAVCILVVSLVALSGWLDFSRIAAQTAEGDFSPEPGAAAPVYAPAFGVHVGEAPGLFTWHVPLAARTGADTVPLEFRWDVVERGPGRFEWARFDEAVAVARANGIRLVGVLHYPAELPPLSRMSRPRWPSAHVDDWDYFVERVVSRYGDEIDDWIVVRGRTGRRDPFLGAVEAELDAQLVRATAAALKRARPGARLFASVLGADLRWLEVFIARGGLEVADGLALEVNRWPVGPEGLERVVEDVRALAEQAGAAPTLWVWRFGYPTHEGLSATDPMRPGVGLAEQAAYVVKTHAVLASAGVSAVIWDELVDRASDLSDARANFGLYESVGRAKPAAYAYATMTRMLSGLRYGGEGLSRAQRPVGDAFPGDAATEGARLEQHAEEHVAESAGGPPNPDVGDLLVADGVRAAEAVEAVPFEADAYMAEVERQGVYVHAHPFFDDDRIVIVVWTSLRPGPDDAETLLRYLDRVPVRVYDMFGERMDGLAPAPEPVYVELALEN